MNLDVKFESTEQGFDTGFGEFVELGKPVILPKEISVNGTYNAATDEANGYNPVTVNVPNPPLQVKTATENGTVLPDKGVYGLSSVVVNVPSPSGEVEITANGTYDITEKETAIVSVPSYQQDYFKVLDRSITDLSDASVENTGKYAFGYCQKLKTVNFPSVKTVGEYAFRSCSVLESVNIPNATTVDAYAFYECVQLKSIDLPNVVSFVGENQFYGCSQLNSVSVPKIVELSNYAFQNCTRLDDVYIPNVEIIGYYALANAYYRKTIHLPKANRIKTHAFYNNYSITAVIVGTEQSSVCELAATSAFSNCYHIEGKVNSKYNPQGLKDGYIYVPDDLVDSYKVATNWITYADQIKPISELPTEE